VSKWLLVTGAKRLGGFVALSAAARGWSIVIHHHESADDAEKLALQVRETGVDAAVVQADFANGEDVEQLVPRAASLANAPILGLMNCAAIFEHDVAMSTTTGALERHFAINAVAPTVLTRALAAQDLPEQGSVVNFLDYKLASPYQDHFSYTISKYALAGATELMARALAPGVRVNAVAPAYALPSPGQSQDVFERQHGATPLGYGVEPEDVASAALFLLEAPAVTGQVLYVDAGQRFMARARDFAFGA
jgi:NAD(P)-dependent dehydrogenase (short-subunit alcohol dehydrogenase family)